MYFMISNSDGDTYIRQLTETELLAELEEQEEEGYSPKFITKEKLETESDSNYWGEAVLIIKGEVIIPKPKEKILSYEL